MMEPLDRYITVSEDIEGRRDLHWWVPDHVPRIIQILEEQNPLYEFFQFVTSPGHGGYHSFIIMKLKEDKI